jgi:hypothetical protein
MEDQKPSRSASLGHFLALLAFAVTLPLPAFAANEGKPCSTGESRQLDYWIGDWTVANPGSTANSTANVHLALDKCLFIESWDNGKGHVGQDMFAYNSDDKNWYGMFTDNEGRVHVFTSGKVADGSAEFDGPSRGPNGEAVLNRVKLVRIAPDKLIQSWEKSTDSGANWTTAFRGEYARRAH